MNLTPEEKQIGKQNFDEATGSTRREFLATIGIVGGTAAVAGIGAKYFHYGPKLDDRLRVGVIGTGDEGNVLMGRAEPRLHRRRGHRRHPTLQPSPRIPRRLVFTRRTRRPPRFAEGLRSA